VNGSIQPDIMVPGESRQSLDLDDFSSGFAAWSGTSFAAPLLAANVIRAVLKPLQRDKPDPALRLDVQGTRAAIERALRALRQLPGLA
jgi:hypothetical protein